MLDNVLTLVSLLLLLPAAPLMCSQHLVRRQQHAPLTTTTHTDPSRSPMAEAVIANEARLRPGLNLRIDSAGTGAYHAGDDADPRTIAVCKKVRGACSCLPAQVLTRHPRTTSPSTALRAVCASPTLTSSTTSWPWTSRSESRCGQTRNTARHSADTLLLSSLQTLLTRKPKHAKARIALFGTFDPDLALASPGARRQRPRAIEDPYYGGERGFDECYEQCVRYARGFLDFLQQGGGDIPKL